MLNTLIYICLAVHIIVCLLLTLLVLMQRPKSEGLGAAFGSSVTDSLFGAQTSDVLTKTTIYLACIFFFLTFTIAILYSHRSSANKAIQQELLQPAPTAPAPMAATEPAHLPEPAKVTQ